MIRPLTTRTVDLPPGWFDGEDRCTAVLRPMRGVDEEWILGLPGETTQARMGTELLRRCVRRIGGHRATRQRVRALPLALRDRLVLAVWQANFGERIELVLTCPRRSCGARMDTQVTVDALQAREPIRRRYPLAAPGADAPAGYFRLPCGGDLERLDRGEDREASVARLLGRCVVTEDGRQDLSGTATVAGSPELRAALEEAMERQLAGVLTELAADCPECGHHFGARFDPVTTLVAEVHRRRAEFDSDVHLLSCYYHWPRREILGLTRPRRRAYVRFLCEQLDTAGTAAVARSGLRRDG